MQQERRRRTQEPIKGFKKNAQADAVGSVVVYYKERVQSTE
jgi:hypothetical protein